MKLNAFQYYVDELNHERLPHGSAPQEVPGFPGPLKVSGFPDLFVQFGAPLSSKAKVKVDEKDVQWTITEVEGQRNAGAKYTVRAVRQSQNINGINVPVIVQMLVTTQDTSPKRSFPPPAGAGNYAGEEAKNADWPSSGWSIIEGYNDRYPRTSPVGSFQSNSNGLYDMGGNVWQWCEDKVNASLDSYVLRGASWKEFNPDCMIVSYRYGLYPSIRGTDVGFRCVVAWAASAEQR
jgi:Sulfatase-modifying factor enzyme 1